MENRRNTNTNIDKPFNRDQDKKDNFQKRPEDRFYGERKFQPRQDGFRPKDDRFQPKDGRFQPRQGATSQSRDDKFQPRDSRFPKRSDTNDRFQSRDNRFQNK